MQPTYNTFSSDFFKFSRGTISAEICSEFLEVQYVLHPDLKMHMPKGGRNATSNFGASHSADDAGTTFDTGAGNRPTKNNTNKKATMRSPSMIVNV
jgi:hypothetical protein